MRRLLFLAFWDLKKYLCIIKFLSHNQTLSEELLLKAAMYAWKSKKTPSTCQQEKRCAYPW